MGRTAYSGPVFGAKSLLWMAHRDNVLSAANSTVTETLGKVRVPVGEDWYVTEMQIYRGSSGTTAATATFQLTDDSTVIADLATASSVTGLMLSTNVTPTAGEYQGLQVLSNSTLAAQVTHGGSSAAISSDVTMWVYGYIRYVDSSRSAF